MRAQCSFHVALIMLDNLSSQPRQALTLLVILSAVSVLYGLFGARKNRNELPYPPGPKGNFLLGNMLDIRPFKSWLSYVKMGKQYNSDILHLSVFGKHIVVLNSVDSAVALLEKRASKYSDRSVSPMKELIGFEWSLSSLPYGDRWRRSRRCFQQNFRKAVSHQYEPLQHIKVGELLQALLTSLDEPGPHFKTIGAAVSLAIIYNLDIKPPNDYYLNVAEEALSGVSEVVLPGSALVNVFPGLRHLPRWVPGIGFQKAAAVRKLLAEMKDGTFEYVRSQMKKGNNASLVARLLEENDATGVDDVEIIKEVAATAYAAGSDPISSAIKTFFYSMGLHPEIQKKAQEVIDRVVGNQRLPGFHDRESMPYIDAIYREVMRIRPVLPMGLPHTNTEDDIYNGYFIPKGSTVFANIWAMTHDEERYPKANQFIPERFLNERGELNNDSTVLAYGFGRRLCPGRHMASSTIWLTIASILATFNIHKSEDDTGSEEEVEAAYRDGATSHPDFKCTLSPRSSHAIKLIQEND